MAEAKDKRTPTAAEIQDEEQRAAEADSVHEDVALAAERQAVTYRPKTLLNNSYRGRR